ncbi:thiolase family protein [Burkholderia cenocepacia]|uniref:Thiolase n=1 Tax=Burkholderia cenocepacia (strain ATCC BAA-245 / DSM 16553 / LMG 16656 / NCTC 13227 / J2315 / CF5610) TaxID=216591 RepID=B4EH27_BURCJ|nr:thiolase family protein [Burkholderia cenocepacia]KIS49955.1 3-Oxoacyl-[acyl-carrier-(ACP)] synthase III family protein [Burkholderia cepacia]EPZ90478.1 thiolase, C-terminal domain protein [Burkholderia cenocepacia K56-2Valvano]ERI24709.1 thiolase, C-terminal domain protein [Burkholderia cenocepacia BC7]KKI80771.1 thiolase [Burkholderia cenocepacia]MBR8386565.1 thiolase family protein [Burkholderia cenocepacia]
MSNIYIAGIAMTVFGRHLDRSLDDLAREALQRALRDAGCHADAIRAAFYAGITNGALQGQLSIPGQVVFSKIGLEGIPVFNVENACASGSTAVHLAVRQLQSGACDVALALGAEKMNVADKAKSFALFDAGWDVSRVDENFAMLARLGEGIEPPPGSESDRPYSRFMKIYAALCRHHMHTYGTTQRQIAAVSAKNHGHSVHNPYSQFRQPFTIDEVLAAAPITYPITLPMCAPLSDGAAAAILCTEEGLERIGADRGRCIRIAASVIRSFTRRRIDEPHKHIGRLAALQAYEQAGVGPEDMDVAEVHDASAMGEIIQAENLGFVPLGEGGPAAERGEFTLGGRIPINTSGGLESKGHPLGATGIGQLYELVTQLRGEAGARQVDGARHAIQENGGGLQGVEEAALAIHILSRD